MWVAIKTIWIVNCLGCMKSSFFKVVICALALISFSVPAKVDLTVNITGFSNDSGNCFVALFRPEDSFPEITKQFKGKVVAITNKSVVMLFENIPKGKYAVAVFHDVNKNGVLDKNLFGAPTEKYGFSNNARETFSAPSFGKACINLDVDKSISIKVK
jgi:uncharacterized protein (DUF2141 family)